MVIASGYCRGLLVHGIAAGTRHYALWRLDEQTSVIYGLIFLGSAVYFAYGLQRPVWGNAKGQLLGFLAYDLVLIIPFVRLLFVSPSLSLIVYLAVILASAALAIWYLAISRRDRLWMSEVSRDDKLKAGKFPVDAALVERLIAGQFPQWAGLRVQPVALDGWDNWTFHLGDRMVGAAAVGRRVRAASGEGGDVAAQARAASALRCCPCPLGSVSRRRSSRGCGRSMSGSTASRSARPMRLIGCNWHATLLTSFMRCRRRIPWADSRPGRIVTGAGRHR